MDHDNLFDNNAAHGSDFIFDEEVARVFDDMLARSIPFYLEQQKLLVTITDEFYLDGTKVTDLGCSTGTTLINLAKSINRISCLQGFDNASAMLEKATDNTKLAGIDDRIHLAYADLNGDLSD